MNKIAISVSIILLTALVAPIILFYAIFVWNNYPFNTSDAKAFGDDLLGKKIYYFSPSLHKTDEYRINDIEISVTEFKEMDTLYIGHNTSISREEIKRINKYMRKYGYIHFYGNDTSYFFITGGFLNDVYGHFYLNYEIDSIEMKKITSKHDAYNYQKMKGETSWYEFGPVLPKYD